MVRRVPHRDAPDLTDLVDDVPTFLATDVLRRASLSPGATSGRDPSQFATVDGLWDGALNRGLRTPGFRLVRDGATLNPAEVTRSAGIGQRTVDGVIQPNRVLELHAGGATMVLQGLQLTDPRLGRLANNVALALDHPVQVNAYLTPRGTKGLDLHFDYHDVFVVQLDGAKRWRIWEPIERTVALARARRIARPTFDELGPPKLDLVLRAGDSLYLPRGFPHAAEAVDESSAHLTIGVMNITWQRVLSQAVAAMASDRSTAASVPVRALDAPGALRPPDAAVLALASTSRSIDRPDLDQGAHVARRLANEIWRRQPATRLRPLHPEPIDDGIALEWTAGPLLWLCRDGERARLGLGDRELDLPGETYGFLLGLLGASGPLSVALFADMLDLSSRRVVVRRLVAEGVLARA